MAYTPANSMTLESKRFTQIRLGILGAPNVGKTTGALTFPNPVVADFDNKLSSTNAHYAGKALSEITIIPFYQAAFCDKLVARRQSIWPPNKRDAFLIWMMNEAVKLQEDQTLIVDSWTMLQAAFDQQQNLEPATSKTGAEDKFVFWAAKMAYAKEVCEKLKTLTCHVVVTFHETIERDDEGRPNGKMLPIMQGKFADQVAGHFNNWFRAITKGKLKNPADPRSEVIGSEHFWQTASDNTANCGTTLMGMPPLVPAHYDVFANPDKYRKK